MYRIGSGIDFHQLVEERPFYLGGVLIPHHKGAWDTPMLMYCYMHYAMQYWEL
ncbi:MAG: 2-C-methyl-D-erythritol 2,4-cyclodiphosphate synthase [Chitinophagaceae bacterium]